jgi:hypothetical protein
LSSIYKKIVVFCLQEKSVVFRRLAGLICDYTANFS